MNRLTLFVLVVGLSNWAPMTARPASAQTIESARLLLERDFKEAWLARDADALAGLWLTDGDWMSVVGSRRIQQGRSDLASVWAVGLDGRKTPEEMAISVDVDHVRQISDSVAVVDVVMTFAPDTDRHVRESYVMILKSDGDVWRIASARAARLPILDRD